MRLNRQSTVVDAVSSLYTVETSPVGKISLGVGRWSGFTLKLPFGGGCLIGLRGGWFPLGIRGSWPCYEGSKLDNEIDTFMQVHSRE